MSVKLYSALAEYNSLISGFLTRTKQKIIKIINNSI